jgi:hypothetical protein
MRLKGLKLRALPGDVFQYSRNVRANVVRTRYRSEDLIHGVDFHYEDRSRLPEGLEALRAFLRAGRENEASGKDAYIYGR